MWRLTEEGVDECNRLQRLAEAHLVCKNASRAVRSRHAHDAAVHELRELEPIKLTHLYAIPLVVTQLVPNGRVDDHVVDRDTPVC